MDGENPTAGDSGASITDRLERMLSGPSEPEQTQPQEARESAPIEASPDTEVDTDEGVKQAEPEPLKLSTADLAELLDLDENLIDVADNGKVVIKTKIDGKEGTAKLQDFLKNYQIQGHAENKAREAAEKEKAVQARQAEIEQQAQARMAQVEQLASVAAKELMREYQGIDWNTLRQTDPGQYAALKQEFAERNAQLQGVFQQAAQERAQQQQAMQAKRAEFLQQQAQRLPEVIPEWKDPATQSKEVGEIRDWALKQGFEAQEVDNFTLAHHVAVMRKAMLYDRLQEKRPVIENRVRTAPKIVKPGQTVENGPDQQMRNLRTQIKASGGKKGIAEYLIASGKV